MSDLIQQGMTREEIIAAGRSNINFFGMLCIPETFTLAFPPLYVALFNMLTEDKELNVDKMIKIALGLPRGFAKTVFLKLLVCWLVLYSDRRFILIVCNTATLAENFLADVASILSSPNIVAVYGDWKSVMPRDRGDSKVFRFAGRSVILAAIGSNSSVRGVQLEMVRPDVMLMDDMQSKEQAKSETVSNDLLDWMVGTLMKANNKRRCLFIFVGNMYPYEGSILKRLKHNPAWLSVICGAILEDGESIWPELRSVESLMDEFEDDLSMGRPEIFFAEVMNDETAGARSGIDINKIKIWRHDDLEPDAACVIVDPAGKKKKSDQTAIGGILVYGDSFVYRKILAAQMDPMETIRKSLSMAFELGTRAVIFESVGYQATLGFWFDRVCQQLGVQGAMALEIHPKGVRKNTRIMNFLLSLVSPDGQIYLHPDVRTLFVHQLVYFDPLREDNRDDILDVGAYIQQAVQEHRPAMNRFVLSEATPSAGFTDTLNLPF